MERELEGRTAIVTGGTGGLGPAVARALLEAGAHCVITFKSKSRADELDTELAGHGYSYTLQSVDILDQNAVDAMVRGVLSECGQIDILAHLVGGYMGGNEVQDMPLADWRLMFDLNVNSAFIAFKAVLPAMQARNYGRIIAVGSRSAVRISPGVSGYTASKAALLALVESVAEENHARDVTANAVLPSIIDTALNRAAMPKANRDTWPKPEQIAEVFRFLASDRSGLVSGAAIPVYGHA
ncbi:MAG: short-chain dehydrogenase/reductase [Chloroflexi bacterium]|jgi:NAD(P)-dependent dehydrogenase (short-subunit alcohol dehydrogenase family)|nr:short-chain dehydrogenase/reductase [Chloroflexota bacterium]